MITRLPGCIVEVIRHRKEFEVTVNLPKVKKKHVFSAYLAWLLLGLVGTHRFYLKRDSAWIMLLLFIVQLFVPLPFARYAGMVLTAWWLLDAFLIPGMVEHYNIYEYPGSPYKQDNRLPALTKDQYPSNQLDT